VPVPLTPIVLNRCALPGKEIDARVISEEFHVKVGSAPVLMCVVIALSDLMLLFNLIIFYQSSDSDTSKMQPICIGWRISLAQYSDWDRRSSGTNFVKSTFWSGRGFDFLSAHD
jgi:hypothetical protein